MAKIESEKKTLEEFLVQQKNAAADQAEILARTQKREVDITERLGEVSVALEQKEASLDALTKTKAALEKSIKELEEQLASQNDRIDRIEKDKHLKRGAIEASWVRACSRSRLCK